MRGVYTAIISRGFRNPPPPPKNLSKFVVHNQMLLGQNDTDLAKNLMVTHAYLACLDDTNFSKRNFTLRLCFKIELFFYIGTLIFFNFSQ